MGKKLFAAFKLILIDKVHLGLALINRVLFQAERGIGPAGPSVRMKKYYVPRSPVKVDFFYQK